MRPTDTGSTSPCDPRRNTADRSIRHDLADPQLGAIPWHVRMSPLEPRKPASVGTDDRIGIEVRTFNKHVAGRANHNDGVVAAMLAHADQSRSRGVHAEVCVARAVTVRERDGSPAALLLIHDLVGEVAEVDDAVVHRVGAAAIFVHARAHVESCGSDVLSLAPPDDHASSTFGRPPFNPVHVAMIDLDLIKPKRARGHASRGEG